MDKTATTINILTDEERGGIMRVFNPDKTLARSFKMTLEELRDLQINNVLPAGVSREEWDSGLAVADGRAILEVGDAIVKGDGQLLVIYEQSTKGGKVIDSFAKLTPTEWQKTGDVVEVDTAVYDGLFVRKL